MARKAKASPVRPAEAPQRPDPMVEETEFLALNWGDLAEGLVVCAADLLESFIKEVAAEWMEDMSAPATREEVFFAVLLALNAHLTIADTLALIKDDANNGYEVEQFARAYNSDFKEATSAIATFLMNNT